jgi:cell division protein FtsB
LNETDEEPREEQGPQGADWRPLLGVAGAFILALLSLAAVKSYRDLQGARDRERGLETSIQAAGKRIERLHGHIERLRSDPGTLERLAREDLGLVRPGDVVLVLPAADEANPATPTKPTQPQARSDVTQRFER